ncbi:MAG: cysteine--tRNA ligase [Treponema sp.]|nr:cysteine--tRNA ligase [Treponema sp.]
MALKLYNTMGRKIEVFVPIQQGKCSFYGCGPTVYNYAHIGNLRAYVFLDLLNRALSFLGYDVKYVMNITDIGHLTGDSDDGEDKMLKTAKERGQSVLEIAQFYTEAFFNDIDRLNIRRPNIVCKATEHINEMIELIKRLEKNGHTYMAGGNLYFDVTTFPNYGKLAMLNLDDLKTGAGKRDIVVVDKNKRNPHDFVLWFTKSKFENQALVWDSPWGIGYPGWHIECSAMSMKYLGEQFDIHTGGIDHIPIHHTNEIAQSEGATGKKWVNYWLHNEFLIIAKDKNDSESTGGKMSKSSGNFLTLQSLIDKGYEPLDYRFFLLGAHYRSQVAFSWDAMDSAKNSRKALIQRISKCIAQVVEETADIPTTTLISQTQINDTGLKWINAFTESLENDLATPKALSELQGAIKDKNMSAMETLAVISKMDTVIGLDLIENSIKLYEEEKNIATGKLAPELESEVQKLIAERNDAKKSKNYERADEIRNSLASRGIILVDTTEGTIWKTN